MPIEWNETIAIDVREIDDQHHRFVDLIAKLERAVADGTIGKHLSDIFDELHAYIKYHFKTEEEHFVAFGCYPNAEAHVASHRAFEAHVDKIRSQFLDDQKALTTELSRAMYDWLLNHIKHMDREYIECFKAHNL